MLNEKRIRLMTKLARYESGEGKEELRIARYYRLSLIHIYTGKYVEKYL